MEQVLKFFLVSLVVSNAVARLETQKKNILAKCLHQFISNENVKDSRKFSINIQVNSQIQKFYFNDAVNGFLAIKKINSSVEIMSVGGKQSAIDFHTRILLVGSFSSFKILISQPRQYASDISGLHQFYYVILPSDISSAQLNNLLEEIMKYCLLTFIVNVNVLFENANGYIKAYTYFPYDIESCKNDKPILYNVCKNGNLKWKKPSFPRKLDNFWKCPLKVVLWDEPPFLNFHKNKLVSGIDAYYLETLKEMMNFSIRPVLSREGRGNTLLNGTSFGAFKLLNEGQGDLMLGGSICTKERKTHFAATVFYLTIPVKLILKQPESYNSLEILLFPFDSYTWLIILVLFVGREIVKTILNDFFRNAIGLGSFSLMKTNLIPWLFGFFILKSSYEGSVFKFLHKRPRRAVPEDFKEAIQNGYNFISDTKLNLFLKDFTEFDKKLKLYDIPSAKIFDKFYQLDDGKLGLISRGESLVGNHLNSSMLRGLSVVENPIVHNFLCIYMPKFSYLTAEFNKRIEQMVNHGYVKRIVKNSTIFSWNSRGGNKEAIVLTVNHLSGAFQLLMALLALALCVFVLEVLAVR